MSGPLVLACISTEDRVSLLRHRRSMLGPGGQLALVSTLQGKSIAACNVDLALRSTAGRAPLPFYGVGACLEES